MTNTPTQSAKELVLQFVREKNPQSVTIHGCHKCDDVFGFKSLGLPELLIATQDEDWEQCQSPIQKKILSEFDLTKNLHNQSEDFFTSLLPLING